MKVKVQCNYCGKGLEENKPNKKFCSMTCKDSYKTIEREIKKNFISIKEHEKIVNKRQKIFLETISKLANQMLGLKAKVRKELKEVIERDTYYFNVKNFKKYFFEIIDEALK